MKTCVASVIALVLALPACGGGEPEPSVAIVSYTPEALDPADDLADDLTITVEYDDGDGDLGGGTATVHDCRVAELATALEIPPIAAPDAVESGIHITGELVLTVADVGDVTPTSAGAVCSSLGVTALAPGEVAFCVVLTDAAGHSGPGDCTAAIPIAAPTL